MNVRRARTRAAWVLVVVSTVGWPASALTVARGEPPFVLGLSWVANILIALDLLTSSQVHEEQGGAVVGDSRRRAGPLGRAGRVYDDSRLRVVARG